MYVNLYVSDWLDIKLGEPIRVLHAVKKYRNILNTKRQVKVIRPIDVGKNFHANSIKCLYEFKSQYLIPVS